MTSRFVVRLATFFADLGRGSAVLKSWEPTSRVNFSNPRFTAIAIACGSVVYIASLVAMSQIDGIFADRSAIMLARIHLPSGYSTAYGRSTRGVEVYDRERAQTVLRSPIPGVPRYIPDCTVGDPIPASTALVDSVVGKYLSEQDCHLVRQHRFTIPGCDTILDGYDPEKRVGYLIIDEEKSDAEINVTWRGGLNQGVARFLDTLYKRRRKKHPEPAPDMDAVERIADPRRRELAFLILIDPVKRTQVDLNELRALQDHIHSGKDRILIVSRFDPRFQVREGQYHGYYKVAEIALGKESTSRPDYMKIQKRARSYMEEHQSPAILAVAKDFFENQPTKRPDELTNR